MATQAYYLYCFNSIADYSNLSKIGGHLQTLHRGSPLFLNIAAVLSKAIIHTTTCTINIAATTE